MKNRIYKYDNIKALLIFSVVLGHLLISFTYDTCNSAKILSAFIYSFHMPLFFIISGYFSKNDINKKTIIKLVLIFLIMNISFSIYDYLIIGRFELFKLKYASWFILLLLIYRLFVKSKKIKSLALEKTKEFLLLAFFISIFIPFINTNLFILRIFENFIYFIFGYLLNNKKINIKVDNNYLSVLFFFLLLINLYIGISNMNNISLFFGSSYTNKIDLLTKTILIISNISIFLILQKIIINKEIPIITNIGRNSLIIYMIHRIPTLLLGTIFIPDRKAVVLLHIVLSIIMCIILSSKYIVKPVEAIINKIVVSIYYKKLPIIVITIIILVSLLLMEVNLKGINNNNGNHPKNEISIGFLGDLILLEDQVNLSKTTFSYNFDYMFKYTNKYIKKTDYTIGVFEGPSDDSTTYSYGNFTDNKELIINHPSKFINSIKNAGIDLVTTANNHVYDKGYYGALSTINNLNNRGLDFVGTSTNKYPERKIVYINGLKVGILAYTYASNYKNDTNNRELVKYLTDPNSIEYNNTKKSIEEDFKHLKDNKVDLVIVLPHYGEQFNFAISKYQDEYNKLFSSLGANIILGDHSHVIGPITKYNNTLVVSSPGNYVNSYNGLDSDISDYIIITVKNKKVVKVEAIPLLAVRDNKGYYPISLYDLKKQEPRNHRIEEALKIFGNTVINNKNIKLQEKYEITDFNINDSSLELDDIDKESVAYNLLSESNRICFIGDSITEGTMNNYSPWYLELMNNFENKEVINISKGSYTTDDIIKDFSNIIREANCDLSVINIGTNDIRYNKTNPDYYINNIKKIIDLNKDSKILLLSPWETYSNDKVIGEDIWYKKDLYGKYNSKLISLAKANNSIYYINPNRYIRKHIYYEGEEYYLLDGVHPNENEGIKLYSYSVLRGLEY